MLKSFVVRVYRADKEGMSGEVETVLNSVRMPFRDKEELWRILWAGTGHYPIKETNGDEMEGAQ